MANKYAVASGLWSATATWSDTDGGAGGAVVPADGDAPFISAGVSVTMDVNQSAFTGLQTVTVRGGVTPGTLIFKDGTSGWLKIRTGYNLVGTLSTNKGRILANSDGVWGNAGPLAFANKAVIDLQGTATLDATNLDIRMYCTQPVNLYVRTYGAMYTSWAGSAAADTLTKTAHGLTDTTPVMVRSSGTLPAPLQVDTLYYIVSKTNDTIKLALVSSGSAINLTSDGTGTIDVYTGHSNTATGIMNVLDDVTADTCWTTTAEHNAAVLVDIGPADYDQQRVNLSAITADTITLSTNVDSAQYPGARIYLSSRNISIRSTGVSNSQAVINTSVNNTINCEIKNTAGSGTTFYGRGLSSCSGNTVLGIISGLYFGLVASTGDTISTIVACSSAMDTSFNNTITNMLGCVHGIGYGAGGNTVTNIFGCTNGLNGACNGNTVTNIFGCTSGLSSGASCNSVTNIFGCTNAITTGSSSNIVTNISGCTNGLTIGASENTITGDLSGCLYPVRFPVGTNYLKNAFLGTTTAQSFLNRNVAGYKGRIACENLNRVNGLNKIFDCFGDIIQITCNGISGAPSVDPNSSNGYCIEVSNVQSLCSVANELVIFDKHRIWLTAGTHTVTYKLQSTFTGTLTTGDMLLSATYLDADGQMVTTTANPTISTRTTDSDWSQAYSVTFTTGLAGWIDMEMALQKYEAGKVLYVWPNPVIS